MGYGNTVERLRNERPYDEPHQSSPQLQPPEGFVTNLTLRRHGQDRPSVERLHLCRKTSERVP
jgi:hypothetical protein